MAASLDSKDLVPIDELAISNMWEVGALSERLHEKGLVKKPELLDKTAELRRTHPQATTLVDNPPSSTRRAT